VCDFCDFPEAAALRTEYPYIAEALRRGGWAPVDG